MKREKHVAIMIVICFISYFMMTNLSMAAEKENMSDYSDTSKSEINRNSIVYDLRSEYFYEKSFIKYISQITELPYDESEFIVKECKNSNFDPYVLLGMIKRESNFNTNAVGTSGERGLGQLMDNTAKPVAENLGYIYDPNKLFDAKYNLKITITQIAYLYNLYGGDIHMALTAYNRGQQGLQKYISENKSPYDDPVKSEYSVNVLNFAYEFKEEFENSKH